MSVLIGETKWDLRIAFAQNFVAPSLLVSGVADDEKSDAILTPDTLRVTYFSLSMLLEFILYSLGLKHCEFFSVGLISSKGLETCVSFLGLL